MTAHPQELPFGICDYEAIRSQDMVYVDKSQYFAGIEQTPGPVRQHRHLDQRYPGLPRLGVGGP